ncbi:MAG: S-adenosylmethionine hydrolase [Gammaproteobacteria bacterium]|jgi:S-adenosylmethionine hydrolase
MSDSFNPCGVITVTTDFGHRGPFVGTMKGVVLNRFPAAKIIDLTHEAFVHWPAEAGFWLERSFRYFPTGTVHLAVVDPGVGTDRSVLLVIAEEHLFIAPDNGLLAGVIESCDAVVICVEEAKLAGISLESVSATFHGRDIFAPLAAALAAGQITPTALGAPTEDFIPSLIDPPHMRGAELHGIVITSDNFGNLITNIDRSELVSFKSPIVHAGGHDIPLLRTYADVAPGGLLALINSLQVVEIARSEQSAAELLGIGRGAPVLIRDDG